MDLTDIYGRFCLKAAEYTVFSSAHGTCSRTDQMLGHKTSLKTFINTDIIASIFSDHSGMNEKSITKRKL